MHRARLFCGHVSIKPTGNKQERKYSQQTEGKECILSLSVAVLSTNTPLPAVLKRATTIKRRGMDAGHRGQSGEEQYSDISSVGESERHTLAHEVENLNTEPRLCPSPRCPHGKDQRQEHQTRANGVLPSQGATLSHLHPPRGEDAHLLLDRVEPGGA